MSNDPTTTDRPERSLLDVLSDVILDNVGGAARCSHRPDNVVYIWNDANSRAYMSSKILDALGLNPGWPESYLQVLLEGGVAALSTHPEPPAVSVQETPRGEADIRAREERSDLLDRIVRLRRLS